MAQVNIVEQVNELANLQGRSQALIDLAVENSRIRASIGATVSSMQVNMNKLREVLISARAVSDRVTGANKKQSDLLDALEAALRENPSTDLEKNVGELSTLISQMSEGPAVGPAIETAADIERGLQSALSALDQQGGYQYGHKRRTPSMKKSCKGKNSSNKSCKRKTTHRRHKSSTRRR
jgi:hypothetical protein